ncbi:MAG TPA: hypothetical protein VE959_18005 [Bryobacteraceae bacterium]|nr:hypothetical protein [Bryobacteraceae bacterium]
MAPRLFSLFLIPALLLTAASKKTIGAGHGENEDLSLTMTVYVDPADVKELIGSDLGGHYVVAEVKVEPKYGKEIAIDRDDFVLRTDKDGEKAKPFVGGQIAGQDALVVSGGEVKQRRSGWGIGGGPIMMGSGGAHDQGPTSATMKSDDQANPVLKVLDAKILKEGKTSEPVSGLLYFALEKQKLKDLELQFGGRENRISFRFK